jgi:hypothetical protein
LALPEPGGAPKKAQHRFNITAHIIFPIITTPLIPSLYLVDYTYGQSGQLRLRIEDESFFTEFRRGASTLTWIDSCLYLMDHYGFNHTFICNSAPNRGKNSRAYMQPENMNANPHT